MARARILIVEDEALISMMLEDFIETLDYEIADIVESLESGLSAVEEGGFDVAVLDVNLRDRKASWPIADALDDQGIPFFFTSGADLEKPPERHQSRVLLAKPFTLHGIDDALKKILAG
ncbi:response regulator [Parasphingopyxis lamellibrachiae]|uniref:Response regulator receiver domain-containing protein n=1 Tax=Parasphingopyxis lamellibrachiae TaxID=680125 RepID=A0A3D9FCX5_9SPHN|nr:response regulator [Parasphingopyxis lamellibrachiae]RED15613.1 response regulator receiver domain-containing protein [Parasphingopyxis lamellibrachiae]